MLRTITVLSVAAALAGFAPPPEPAEAEITRPDWLKRPSSRDLAAVWPAAAVKRGLSGRGVIKCEVTVEGTLRACVVVAEKPAGSGFGVAALALAPQFRMTPQRHDGRPVANGTVTIPINFQSAGPAPNATGRTYLPTPIFVAAPTTAQVLAAYPDKARDIDGRVVMDCEAKLDGSLHRCDVASEEPRGRGFGRAAESLAPYFRVPETLPNGESVNKARVRTTVQFSPSLAAGQQIAQPEWGRLPDGADVASLFPAAAVQAGVREGRVMLDCKVAVGGTLRDCEVTRETPAGLGFADAALGLSRHFQMRPWTSDGRPIDGAKVRVPVIYRAPEAAAAPAS